MARSRSVLLLLPVLLLAVSACGSSTPDDSRSAEVLVGDAADAMAAIESAAFTIEHTGGDVFIDDGELAAFQSADGRYAAPASAEAVIAVEAAGFRTEVGLVAVDGEVWMTNPLTGVWDVAPAAFAFDPADLFDAEEGLPALLDEAAPTAELVEEAGDDEPEGRHVTMTIARERVAAVTGGLVDADTDADVWIDPATDRLVEIRFETLDADVASNWRITFTDYDLDVEIVAPELGTAP